MEKTKNKTMEEAKAIEDEMSATWIEKQPIFNLPAPIKRKYYQRPYRYQDTVEIWSLTNGQFVVFYSPTGAKFLFNTWQEALKFRNSRIEHLKVAYRAFGEQR